MSKEAGWIQNKTRTSPKTGKTTTRFIARITPPGGTEITKSFTKQGRANQPGTAAHWLHQQREAIHKGRSVNARERGWTVGEWCDAWLNSYTGVTADTIGAYRNVIETDIKPSGLGDEPLRSVDRVRMGRWIRELTENRWWAPNQKPLAQSTAQARRTVAAMIFTAAEEEDLIPRNPMRKVRVATNDVTAEAIMPEELPTREELWHLYDIACDKTPLFAPQILIAAGTGMRPGEMLGLQQRHIRGNEIHITRQRRMKSSTVVYGPPKSAAGVRRIPIGPTVEQAFKDHLAQHPAAPDDPIFQFRRRDGERKPWHRSTWADHWNRVRIAAGKPTLRIYLLRHYYASVLIDGGASVKVVMERMGHNDSKYTLERYTHLWPNTEEVTRSLSESGLYLDKSGTDPVVVERIVFGRSAPKPPGRRVS